MYFVSRQLQKPLVRACARIFTVKSRKSGSPEMRHIMQQSETQQVTEITETGKLPFGGSLVKGQQWLHQLLPLRSPCSLWFKIRVIRVPLNYEVNKKQ